MKTYNASTQGKTAFLGVLFVLVGLFLGGLVMGAVVKVIAPSTSRPMSPLAQGILLTLIVAGAVAGAAYLGWIFLWCRAYAVTLPGDGSIELTGVLHQMKIPSTELVALELFIAPYTYEREDLRQVRVRSRRGSMVVPYFAEIEGCIAEIRAQNPHIAVRGSWSR